MRPTTRTNLLIIELGDISCPIPQQRHPFFRQRRQDNLAFLLKTHRLKREWIDTFHKEMILPQMQPIMLVTVRGHPRTAHLGQPIDIMHIHVPCLHDPFLQTRGEHLRAEQPISHLQPFRIKTHLHSDLPKMHRIRGDPGDERGPIILHEFNLSFRLSLPRGDHQCTDLLRPVMKTEPTRERPIGDRVLENILFCQTGHGQAACHHLGPDLQVISCVTRRDRHTGRP